jgi:hypothetical protein
MRTRTAALVASVVVSVLALPGTALAAGGRPLATAMDGAQEAPGPGDPDATGLASFTLNQGRGTVCFDLAWSGVDGTVFAAHIHEAPPGAPGGIVVPLFAEPLAGTDSASGCVEGLEKALVKQIRKDPAAYYVNVHSDVYPAGAVRGQLG